MQDESNQGYSKLISLFQSEFSETSEYNDEFLQLAIKIFVVEFIGHRKDAASRSVADDAAWVIATRLMQPSEIHKENRISFPAVFARKFQYTRAEEKAIRIALEVISRLKNGNEKNKVTDAISDVATKRAVSYEAARAAYYGFLKKKKLNKSGF